MAAMSRISGRNILDIRAYHWHVDGVEAKKRRKALKRSLDDVGAFAGINGETVRKFENGGNVLPEYAAAITAAITGLEAVHAMTEEG